MLMRTHGQVAAKHGPIMLLGLLAFVPSPDLPGAKIFDCASCDKKIKKKMDLRDVEAARTMSWQ